VVGTDEDGLDFELYLGGGKGSGGAREGSGEGGEGSALQVYFETKLSCICWEPSDARGNSVTFMAKNAAMKDIGSLDCWNT
jgi:hypothetical protein